MNVTGEHPKGLFPGIVLCCEVRAFQLRPDMVREDRQPLVRTARTAWTDSCQLPPFLPPPLTGGGHQVLHPLLRISSPHFQDRVNIRLPFTPDGRLRESELIASLAVMLSPSSADHCTENLDLDSNLHNHQCNIPILPHLTMMAYAVGNILWRHT